MTDAPDANPPEQPEAPNGAEPAPAGEATPYRRRARQAEERARQLAEQLDRTREQIEQGGDRLATAEAQRDEALAQLQATENRSAAERRLLAAGVVDLDAARTLLRGRIDLDGELEPAQIDQAVDDLLLDKPFLQGAPGGGTLPSSTAAARAENPEGASRLADAARRAATTGNRRDVAEYLRLRRSSAPTQ